MNIMKTVLILQVLLGQFNLEVLGKQTKADATINPSIPSCKEHKKCDQCIQTQGCMWCSDKKPSPPLESRCFANTTVVDCTSIENPQSSVKVEEDNKYSTTAPESDTSTLKTERNHTHTIHPQVVHLALRKGESMKIDIEYMDEKHRPLDLYILMDLSCSMKQHKETVANLASSLAKDLEKLTNNLQIGFGSFVDKPLAPFGLLAKSEGCQNTTTVQPYGFQNHLELSKDIDNFISKVKSSAISTNIDFPEGTLEGLLQSIVCTTVIGWRKDKGIRKLIVVSTDGPYHLAGDGKLVGVVLPHDGKCHMDKDTGVYTHATILDYPSISVVRQRIQENDVFVIFAVTEEQKLNYEQLVKELEPFAVAQRIDNENNSITTVIANEYKKLVDTVTLLYHYKKEYEKYIDITMYAKCPGEQNFTAGNQCSGVKQGTSVRYQIEVKLKDCPSSSNRNLWQSTISVYPHSSSEDADAKMAINLSMLCGCDCENPLEDNSNTANSPKCSDHGFLQCGICKCRGNWSGPICNCTGDNVDKKECFNPDTGEECSKRGTCDSCGKCNCNPDANNPKALPGKHCQWNNTDCLKLEDKDKGLCNQDAGQGQGYCQNSICVCNSGYSGRRCECPTSEKNCRDPESLGKVCNGFGSCHCGECVCDESHKGPFCKIQHAQVQGSCDLITDKTKECVRCLVSQNENGDKTTTDESKSKNCKEECYNENIIVEFKDNIVGSFPVEESKHVCPGTHEDWNGCRIDFIIREMHIHNGTIFLESESEKTIRDEKCPIPPNLLLIIIGVVGGIVLIGGVLLLLWKVVTHIQDRKEYARFEKEISDAAWETQNPLYTSTITEFQNPAYADS